jgi:PAS domain S-box-containing protein
MVAIKANAAVCLMFLGISLWLRISERQTPVRVKVAQLLAAIVAVVGLLSFLEFIFGWDLGIDQLLFVETPAEAGGSIRPGLMSPVSAITLVLLGLAVALLDWVTKQQIWPGQFLALAAGLLAAFSLLDLALAPYEFHTYISLPSAAALLVISVALVWSRHQRGLPAWLKNQRLSELLVLGLAWGIGHDRQKWHRPLAYVIAVIGPVISLFAYKELDRVFGGTGPFTTFYPVVVFSALLGLGPGLIATLLSAFCVAYFIFEPYGLAVTNLGDVIALAVFMLTGVFACALTTALDLARRRVAEQLYRSEAELKEAQRIAHLASWWIEAATGQCSWSPELYELLGLKPDPSPLPFSARKPFYTEESWNRLKPAVSKTLTDGPPFEIEVEMIGADGSTLWILSRVAAVRNNSGVITGLRGVDLDITPRKQAEEKLARASRYTRSLIEASLDPLVTISREGRITDVNAATEQVTGLSREHLIGTDFSDYFTEPETARKGYQEVFERGFVRDYPLSIRHKSGTIIDVLYHAAVFRGESGRIEGVFAAARDISERKRAERALQRSEERYRSLTVATTQIVWSTNANGEMLTDMPEWRALTGATVDEIRGFGWLDSLHPDDRDKTALVWRTAVQTRTLYDIEYRVRRHDGVYRYFSVRGVPVLESDGAIREWIGTCTDITERKQAEEALRKLNEELEERVKERTAELRRIEWMVSGKQTPIQHPPAPTAGNGLPLYGDLTQLNTARVILDSVGVQTLTDVAGEFLALLETSSTVYEKNGDYAFSRLISGWCQCLDLRSRGQCEASDNAEALASGKWRCRESCWKQAALPAMVSGKPVDIECAGGIRIYAAPISAGAETVGAITFGYGDPPRESLKLRALSDRYRLTVEDLTAAGEEYESRPPFIVDLAKKRLLAAACLLGEIVQRKRTEREIQQRTAELEAANKELEAFSYSVSHDLRAPLRAINGFAQLLIEEHKQELSAEAQQYLDRLSRGGIHMGHLVDDLLAFSRLGRQALNRRLIAVNEIVRLALDDLRAEQSGRRIEFAVANLPACRADPSLLRQVFVNLISNAIKYTRPREKARIEISVLSGQELRQQLGPQNTASRLDVAGGTPVFYVRDNGIGFDMRYAKSLFGVFQRLHKPREFEGTGVGLATVQRIVQRHGGHVWADAEVDKGATFYFTLGPTSMT